jgi:anti-sigma regulatory factor (Ser/Thr protein kinase)
MNSYSISKKIGLTIICWIIFNKASNSQEPLFKNFPLDSMSIIPYELYTTMEGVTHMTSSIGIWKLKGHQFDGPAVSNGRMYDSKGRPQHQTVKIRNYLAEDSIRSMTQGGEDSVFYFVAHDNFFLWRPNGEVGGWGWPYFNFPKTSPVSKIWIDDDNTLFAGTVKDNFYIIKNAAKKEAWKGIEVAFDKDGNYSVTKGALPVKQIVLQPGAGVYSFAQDAGDKNIIWVGTNRGLFTFDKQTQKTNSIDPVNKASLTITEIYTGENGNIWFSTLEKGMGVYNLAQKTLQFYSYPKNSSRTDAMYPVKSFCYKSPHQFFVAVTDSLPAIFNTENRTYVFIDDSSLRQSANRTTDIKVDKLGNLILLKGGRFYIADVSKTDFLKTSVIPDSTLLAPFFRGIKLPNGIDLATLDYKPELLKKIVLKYDQNSIIVFYDVLNYNNKKEIQFAWKVDGYTNGWVEMYRINFDSAQIAFIQDLKPGKYVMHLKVRVGKEDWRKQMAEMTIIITPPFWQTWLFWTSIVGLISLLVYLIVKLRVRAVRKQERLKAAHEKQLLELEAKALRSQMNPHFIFNCLNSIKSLIQEDEKEKSVSYLTTFSKLIRTLFNNADKKEITLYDEIETCKLYLQLEALRFDAKFFYSVNIDKQIDLKSIYVPVLIIQPFIENAIWHGILPKGGGGKVTLSVLRNTGYIEIIVDDNGIGREASQQNKAISNIGHQSKGVNLTQTRLELDNLLQQRQASLETIDKVNETGKSTGTTVIIRLSQEE